jgi:hypothetical protein
MRSAGLERGRTNVLEELGLLKNGPIMKGEQA